MPKQWDMDEFQEEMRAASVSHVAWLDKPIPHFSLLRDLSRQSTRHGPEAREPDLMLLCEQVNWLVGAVHKIQKNMEAGQPKGAGPDNYDMTVEQVRDLIRAKYEPGKSVYPSDIANEHNLDYDTVVEAIDLLWKEHRAKDGGT